MTGAALFLIPGLPLAGAIFNILIGRFLPRRVVEAVAICAVLGATLSTLWLWPLAADGKVHTLFSWFDSGSFKVGFGILFDRLSAPMTLMVTAVSTLIHLYAAGYMHEDRCYVRFFVLLNLFVFSMLMIVLAENLLVLFLGWEGVGFCSYALIGFWFTELKNANAGRKAFLVTKIGDLFLGIAILTLFLVSGSLSITTINQMALFLDPMILTFVVLMLLGGACGKSAQLPLMTWLPDAMAGPTPVSSLIHAATMVTAGVYLLCRLFPLVSLSPVGMGLIALVGALSAFYAATCALAQREIKRVLAFSTMSQVGYMMLAVGVGSMTGAMFHLFTHAFFKALLFMGAGCVIHLADGENDIHKMGGMKAKSPVVFWLFLAGALCLAGVPLTGGFFSKDQILVAIAGEHSAFAMLLLAIALLTALLTALYSFRLLYLVFAGSYRGQGHPHHLPGLMIWPLIPLALLGLGGGLLNLPPIVGGGESLHHYFGSLAGEVHVPSHTLEWTLAGVSLMLVVGGLLLARTFFATYRAPKEGWLARFLLYGWHFDRLFDLTIVRPFTWIGRLLWQIGDMTLIEGILDGLVRMTNRIGDGVRSFTSGRVSTYVAGMVWGFLLIVGALMIRFLSAGH